MHALHPADLQTAHVSTLRTPARKPNLSVRPRRTRLCHRAPPLLFLSTTLARPHAAQTATASLSLHSSVAHGDDSRSGGKASARDGGRFLLARHRGQAQRRLEGQPNHGDGDGGGGTLSGAFGRSNASPGDWFDIRSFRRHQSPLYVSSCCASSPLPPIVRVHANNCASYPTSSRSHLCCVRGRSIGQLCGVDWILLRSRSTIGH